jgi:hypothetical protein
LPTSGLAPLSKKAGDAGVMEPSIGVSHSSEIAIDNPAPDVWARVDPERSP